MALSPQSGPFSDWSIGLFSQNQFENLTEWKNILHWLLNIHILTTKQFLIREGFNIWFSRAFLVYALTWSHTVPRTIRNPKKNKNQPHVKLQPIGEWGTVIPFTDLKTDLKRTFEKIIEKYWNHLGGAYWTIFYKSWLLKSCPSKIDRLFDKMSSSP